MRKINLSDTPAHFGAEKNPPLYVYDTSGVYTDPNVSVDLKKGLGSVRSVWISERNDTEELSGPSSEFGRQRMVDPATAKLRFEHIRKPRRAKAGRKRQRKCTMPKKASSRQKWSSSPSAKTKTWSKCASLWQDQHPGQAFGAAIQPSITPEFVRSEVARGRAIIPPTSTMLSWNR